MHLRFDETIHMLVVPLMQMLVVQEQDISIGLFSPLAVSLWLHSIWSPTILLYVKSSLDMQIHSQAKLESDLCTSQINVIQAKSKVLVVGWN